MLPFSIELRPGLPVAEREPGEQGAHRTAGRRRRAVGGGGEKIGLGPEDVQAAVAGHTGGNCDETDERAGSIHPRVSCRAPRAPRACPPATRPPRHPLDDVRVRPGRRRDTAGCHPMDDVGTGGGGGRRADHVAMIDGGRLTSVNPRSRCSADFDGWRSAGLREARWRAPGRRPWNGSARGRTRDLSRQSSPAKRRSGADGNEFPGRLWPSSQWRCGKFSWCWRAGQRGTKGAAA